jgi:hypothetical protein
MSDFWKWTHICYLPVLQVTKLIVSKEQEEEALNSGWATLNKSEVTCKECLEVIHA